MRVGLMISSTPRWRKRSSFFGLFTRAIVRGTSKRVKWLVERRAERPGVGGVRLRARTSERRSRSELDAHAETDRPRVLIDENASEVGVLRSERRLGEVVVVANALASCQVEDIREQGR